MASLFVHQFYIFSDSLILFITTLLLLQNTKIMNFLIAPNFLQNDKKVSYSTHTHFSSYRWILFTNNFYDNLSHPTIYTIHSTLVDKIFIFFVYIFLISNFVCTNSWQNEPKSKKENKKIIQNTKRMPNLICFFFT